jgi:ATP-dependent helicase HrpA
MAADGLIKIMTDGMLLAEVQQDPDLLAYDTIIVDEAHERSLNVDFILGLVKKLLPRRPDLKLIITSATIDTDKFAAAFDQAPVIDVSGRMYPVQVRYWPDAEPDQGADATWPEKAVAAVDRITGADPFGDILVFMPTEKDIRDTCGLLAGRRYRQTTVLPLFARLCSADQDKVFKPAASRKIVVATNVAETAITVPGIRYVVDTGLARISRYLPRLRANSLPVVPVSRSSADQRMGRCGRTASGVCIRLYSEQDYNQRPRFTPPEILRTNLAGVILQMMALNLGAIGDFPFIDPPLPASIRDGHALLEELGAIERQTKRRPGRDADGVLTPTGRLMARLPVDPRIARILIEAHRLGCLAPVLIIAAALSIQDPRERPADKAGEADRIHARWADPTSDFISLINLWTAYRQAGDQSTGEARRFCRSHFLSHARMREWDDIHSQLAILLAEAGLKADARHTGPVAFGAAKTERFSSAYTAVHQALLSGFLANIGTRKEKNCYTVTRAREAMLFPGSSLFNRAGVWVLAAEMVETSRLFARTAACIDPAWIEPIAGSLCRRTYLHPRWDPQRAQVVATEQVSLFGLVIVAGRTVAYGPVNPAEATALFVQGALVQGQTPTVPAFVRHNRDLADTVRDMENRLRRRDIIISDDEIADWYLERLEGVWDMAGLKQVVRQKGDRYLRMTQADLMRYDPDRQELERFPRQIRIDSHGFDCRYYFDPGQEKDGLTVCIPVDKATEVNTADLERLVPGLFAEKVLALLKALPKAYRKTLTPLAQSAAVIAAELPRSRDCLPTALSGFVAARFGADIPAAAWQPAALADHLKARIALTGPGGEELMAGRDPALLRARLPARRPDPAAQQERLRWERTGIDRWEWEELPARIEMAGTRGPHVFFPALVVEKEGLALRLLDRQDLAEASHCKGVAALLSRKLAAELRMLRRQILLPVAAVRATTPGGGPKAFEEKLFNAIVENLLAVNLRRADAFNAHAAAVSGIILAEGRRWLEACVAVLEAQAEAQALLAEHGADPGRRRVMQQFLECRQKDLSRLVPPDFVGLYGKDRLSHLVRYIKALALRTQRGVIDLEKDRAKEKTVAPLAAELERLLAALSPATSSDRRQAVEAFFWMLEEFKVAVFAPELKTAQPVSVNRLKAKLKEIEKMV